MGGDEKEMQRGGGVNKDEKEVIKLEKSFGQGEKRN